MKKSELKEIIRECIEEVYLQEKTPNQKAHPRKYSRVTGRRQGTDYGYDELDKEPPTFRKGKVTKKDQEGRVRTLRYNTSAPGKEPLTGDRIPNKNANRNYRAKKVKRQIYGRAVGSKLP